MNAYLFSYRKQVRAVNQPLPAVWRSDLHLIVDALENQMGHNALQGSLLRFYQIDVFRADNYVHRSFAAKALVDAGKFGSCNLHQPVVKHDSV